MKRKFLLMLISCLFVSSVIAEDHPLSSLSGTNIDLKNYDHAFAGSIKDFVVWGFLDEAAFTSELIMRKDGQTIKTIFNRGEQGVGGTITHKKEDQEISTTIKLSKIDGQNQTIEFLFNDEKIVVAIKADGYENSHFINPVYETIVNDETISFKLMGQACYGQSLHYAMMILGAYLH
ncbi:MAG: hypothetical protein ISR65_03325 [Bacteriovoracaceae bacterium]|nr:hypothetical protein [Bacteriovoracaceae bacterium]